MESDEEEFNWIQIEEPQQIEENDSTCGTSDEQNEMFEHDDDVDMTEMSNVVSSAGTLRSDAELTSPTLEMETHLTQKFLKGEITFAEYSSQWNEDNIQLGDEGTDKEEIANISNFRGSKPSTSTASECGVRRRKRGHLQLSMALSGLMGEANLRFARGDFATAEKMCHEVIRQVPMAPEPYQTLAQIYESDEEKCLQYSLLAAHLGPSEADEWLRLAEISKQRHEFKQEMICYCKAIKANPTDLSLHLKRINLLEELNERSYPLHPLRITFQFCYHKIVKCLHPSEAVTILKYAKEAAKLYHDSNDVEKALEVMKDAYNKCSSSFSSEDLNLLLELLISMKLYRECVDVFVAAAGVEVEAIVHTIADGDTLHDQTQFTACRIPQNLPVDLKTKLLVCFIHLKANEIVDELIKEFLQNDVEKTGDLYMDVEEALSAVGEYTQSLYLLELLIKSQHYSLGAVWLRHAECLINLNRDSDALDSLRKVIELAPQHVDARRKLFAILQKTGCATEAADILEQDYSKPINSKLMLEHCQIVKEQNNLEKYLEVGEALLSRTFVRFRHPEELKMARYMKSIRFIRESIHSFRVSRNEEPYDANALVFEIEDILSPDVEWSLFKDLLSVAFKLRKYYIMERLCFGVYSSVISANKRQEIDFLCLQACILNKDYDNAYMLIKEFIIKFDSTRIWNLYNYIFEIGEDNPIKLRFNKKCKDNSIFHMLMANNRLTSGRYQVALSYYLKDFERNEDPITVLFMAVSLLTMASSRTVDKHHSLILQAMTHLMTYKELRKYDQEANYNIGRAYQMLSLNTLAVHYYEKCLQCPSIVCAEHGKIDVQREAAFNLFLIYKKTSPLLARRVLQQYLVF